MPDIKQIITQEILMRATALKDIYTKERGATVAWVCIFAQDEEEYQGLLIEAKKLGDIFEETLNGPKLLLHKPLGTVRILKIRKPDPAKKERGDADFTVSDYQRFKNEYADKQGFAIIPRRGFEMVELKSPSFNVIAYFSDPPIEAQYKDFFKK